MEDDTGDRTAQFAAQRPRLVRLAARVLGDPVEAEDVVQQAWLRLHGTSSVVEDLPAWLTTVTTRLCLDRLRTRTPVPTADVAPEGTAPDPADEVVLADAVGVALGVVLERLTPRERVALVLHDSLAVPFDDVAAVLETTPTSARKLASRARAKVGPPAPEARAAEAAVVDAFMAAAREGDLAGLLRLLAPDAVVRADAAAVQVGTPERIDGRDAVAAFFDGSASAALAAVLDSRPVAAWYDRGEPRVVFDLEVRDDVVQRVTFRADPAVLSRVTRRRRSHPGVDARQGDDNRSREEAP